MAEVRRLPSPDELPDRLTSPMGCDTLVLDAALLLAGATTLSCASGSADVPLDDALGFGCLPRELPALAFPMLCSLGPSDGDRSSCSDLLLLDEASLDLDNDLFLRVARGD